MLSKLLYEPKNSLIHQSFNSQEREEPLNGDGFGLGWYTPELSGEPALFRSISPAWHNQNLKYLASHIRTPCFFAHVRAATVSDVAETNCHPFHYKSLLMMHNGDIAGFEEIQRELLRSLSDPVYHWVRGQTDSEHFFALFLEQLNAARCAGPGNSYSADEVYQGLIHAAERLRDLQRRAKVTGFNYLNIAVTSGSSTVAVRYTDDPELDADSMYYSTGSRYECHGGVCQMVRALDESKAVLIVSEKLTNLVDDWHLVPVNTAVLVNPDRSVQLRPFLDQSSGSRGLRRRKVKAR